MPLVKRFEDLEAWQAARQLAHTIYKITENGPFRRDFGLIDQIRRASVSIMNNVAEGFDSGSSTEFAQFLGYARRSGSEVQSCLYAALDRGHLTPEGLQQVYGETERVRGLVAGLIRYLRMNRSSVITPAHRHTGTPAPTSTATS
jgi:four helix bundle protein